MRYLNFAVLSALLVCFGSVASAKGLSLVGGKTYTYQCTNGAKALATYYNLSDNSLSIVKLTLNGKKYTLPSLVAASGVRYSDMLEIEWWTKGNEASLNPDMSQDNAKLIACKEVGLPKK